MNGLPTHMTAQEFTEIRIALGMNRVNLAKAVGVGRDSLTNYEKGLWTIPLVVANAMMWLKHRAVIESLP